MDGTAHASDNDYEPVVSDTITIAAGDLTGWIHIDVNDDWKIEADEYFAVELLEVTASGRDVSLDTTTTIPQLIENDDAGIARLSANEGADSAVEGSSITLTATLMYLFPGQQEISGATSDQNIVIPITTSDGTAVDGGSGAGFNDFNGYSSGTTITILAGSATGTLTIATNDDLVVENNETFTATPGTIDANGRDVSSGMSAKSLTIESDDGSAAFQFSDVSFSRPTSGSITVSFIVTMTKPVDHDVTIKYYTQDETAISTGSTPDFLRINDTQVTIAPGETQKTIIVTVYSAIDVDDFFYVWIEAVSIGENVSLSPQKAKGLAM